MSSEQQTEVTTSVYKNTHKVFEYLKEQSKYSDILKTKPINGLIDSALIQIFVGYKYIPIVTKLASPSISSNGNYIVFTHIKQLKNNQRLLADLEFSSKSFAGIDITLLLQLMYPEMQTPNNELIMKVFPTSVTFETFNIPNRKYWTTSVPTEEHIEYKSI